MTGENAGGLKTHAEMALQFCIMFSTSVFQLVLLSPDAKEKPFKEGKVSDRWVLNIREAKTTKLNLTINSTVTENKFRCLKIMIIKGYIGLKWHLTVIFKISKFIQSIGSISPLNFYLCRIFWKNLRVKLEMQILFKLWPSGNDSAVFVSAKYLTLEALY